MDRVDEFQNFDLVTIDVANGQMDFEPGCSVEVLLPEEQLLVNDLVAGIMDFVNKLNLCTKPVAKLAASRLVEKLRLSSLPEDSVGTIAEGVLGRLNKVSQFSNDGDAAKAAELQIVEDIIRRIDSPMFKFLSGRKQEALAAINPAISGKVIRAAARICWPQVRAKLGV